MSGGNNFMSALHLQILAKILRAEVSIKESTSETFFQLLVSYTQEIALLSKKSACSDGRTAVNASDVLQHVGDFNSLFQFLEEACVEKRSRVGARSCTTSRKKPRLRPTLASVEGSRAAYKPSFLPVLPTQTLQVAQTRVCPKAQVELEQLHSNVITGVYDEMKRREVESSSKEASVTVPYSMFGRVDGLGREHKQFLRTSIREQGIVAKATGLVSGSAPVLDNS